MPAKSAAGWRWPTIANRERQRSTKRICGGSSRHDVVDAVFARCHFVAQTPRIDHAEIIKRLSGRRTCRGCGASSHIEFEKPKVAGVCDKCQGELYQREDDNEEVVSRRLEIYSEQTEPIISFYKSAGLLKNISALGEVSEITKNAIAILK